MMTPLITGKLVLHYVGEYGRHSELYINDEMVAASFNCNKSIMLLLWCACDSLYENIYDHIDKEFDYVETELGSWLCKTIFKPQLYSKYDVLMAKNATAWAYHDMIYKKKYSDPIQIVLSARQDLFLHVQKRFKINNLEVQYELDENEIYTDGHGY